MSAQPTTEARSRVRYSLTHPGLGTARYGTGVLIDRRWAACDNGWHCQILADNGSGYVSVPEQLVTILDLAEERAFFKGCATRAIERLQAALSMEDAEQLRQGNRRHRRQAPGATPMSMLDITRNIGTGTVRAWPEPATAVAMRSMQRAFDAVEASGGKVTREIVEALIAIHDAGFQAGMAAHKRRPPR